MRESELLSALACREPGIDAIITSEWARVLVLYRPGLRGSGKTLFDAALDLATQMIQHSACPPDVKAALESYDERTCLLTL